MMNEDGFRVYDEEIRRLPPSFWAIGATVFLVIVTLCLIVYDTMW